MDLEGHYPKNTNSHCIVSNETQITLHFFQGRISAVSEIRANLFLAISKTGMCLLTSSFLNVLLVCFPAGQGLKKVGFSSFFKLVKFCMILNTLVIKTLLYNFILNNHVYAVHFRKKIMNLLVS